VDPEVRHAQLGWVVSPAHVHADLSPRAPIDMGRDLESVIDNVLVEDGWYLPSARKTRWTWKGIPMPPPREWKDVFASHKRRHQEELKQIKLRLRERWKEFEGPVMARLADAFQEFSHHALICDRVRQGDQDPSSGLEAAIARILLYRLVRRAREKGLVQGPIPSRPYLSVTSDPSPFVLGLGAAIRHAHAIRHELVARADAGSVRELGQLTAWSIMAFSMYRRMPWAQAAMHPARTAMRAKRRGHVIRIDAQVDGNGMPMVFTGVPAALIAKRKRYAPTSPSPSRDALDEWAHMHLSHQVAWGEPAVISERIESTLAAAAHIELSGIERLLVQQGTNTAAESPSRCVARDDNWPVLTADGTCKEKVANGAEPPMTESDTSVVVHRAKRKDYDHFIGLLNRRTFARLRAKKAAKRKNASDGQRNWRESLRVQLKALRDQLDCNPNLTILISYALEHLVYGSEDGNPLAQNSLRREISQIGWPMLVLLADRSLLSLPAEHLSRLYREVILSKSLEARPYAFEELSRFHRYLVRMHTRPAVDMAELSVLAGSRQLGIKPALLTNAELMAIDEELQADFESEANRADASPDFLRLAQLRRIYFLILDASGIRPGSAYGLTQGDVHFLGDAGDFIHIRRDDYGEAKTDTSLGFVRLEGQLWADNREWVESWIAVQKTLNPSGWRDLPLFGSKPGLRTRVHEHHLSGRLNALLKWACGNRDASCYWLRKTRLSERYQSLASKDVTTARDIYRTMIISGHAFIQIPVERYINDPASLMFVDLRTGCETSRSVLLAVCGLDHGPLDAAWSRAGRDRVARFCIVLDRMNVDVAPVPTEHRSAAPELRRFKSLQPAHVDAYARAMQRHKSRAEACLEAGLTAQQALQLDKAASNMLVRRGSAPWRLSGAPGTRYVLPVTRKIAGTEKWFELLEKQPSDEIKSIAESWIGQPYAELLHGEGALMEVEPTHLAALHALLETTGLELKVVTANGHHLLMDTPHAKYTKGHGAALRWVLSIMWLHTQASSLGPLE
jgi:hypothetical protein